MLLNLFQKAFLTPKTNLIFSCDFLHTGRKGLENKAWDRRECIRQETSSAITKANQELTFKFPIKFCLSPVAAGILYSKYFKASASLVTVSIENVIKKKARLGTESLYKSKSRSMK